MNVKLSPLKQFRDNRGSLVVFLKGSELNDTQKMFGQIYFATFAQKGTVRGNHYHKTRHEWFGIVHGKVTVVMEDVRTKKRKEIVLSAKRDANIKLEIVPYVAHAIKSMTKYASLLSYADEWSKEDTYFYKLI